MTIHRVNYWIHRSETVLVQLLRVITATFKHHFGYPHDLRLKGIDEPIGVTLNHLIWSEDVQDWVQVKWLQPGERVKLHDEITLVECLTARSHSEPVYNIEVDADHVYRVTDNGLLIHNASCNILADSNVFIDTPGMPFGANARAIFDDILADSRFNIYLVRGVATKEILPTPTQLNRFSIARANIIKVRSANVAPLIRADPLITLGKFGLEDLKLIQTAVKRGLPVITSNRKMINQIESGASKLRKQLYGGGKAQILIPGSHSNDVSDLASIL